MTYHQTDGAYAEKRAVFGSGGNGYFLVYVRSPNISPGEVKRFRFKVAPY